MIPFGNSGSWCVKAMQTGIDHSREHVQTSF